MFWVECINSMYETDYLRNIKVSNLKHKVHV